MCSPLFVSLVCATKILCWWKMCLLLLTPNVLQCIHKNQTLDSGKEGEAVIWAIGNIESYQILVCTSTVWPQQIRKFSLLSSLFSSATLLLLYFNRSCNLLVYTSPDSRDMRGRRTQRYLKLYLGIGGSVYWSQCRYLDHKEFRSGLFFPCPTFTEAHKPIKGCKSIGNCKQNVG